MKAGCGMLPYIRAAVALAGLFSVTASFGCTTEVCTATEHDDGSYTIDCSSGGKVTIAQSGTDGSSCTVSEEQAGVKQITCTDGTTATVRDGDNGASCTATNNGDGSYTITCTDGTSITVLDGDDGSAGAPATLISVIDATAAECPDGGGRTLKYGLDDGAGDGARDDGVLHDDEVDNTAPICVTSTQGCGDGVVDAAEECDDGNQVTEKCDYGDASCEVCDAVCRLTSGATSFCGDGVIDGLNSEVCDDGGAVGGELVVAVCDYGLDSCSVCGATCQQVAGATSFCGDGIIDSDNGEDCDDPALGETAQCNLDCTFASCGDGVLNVTAGEECDHGGVSATCDDSCKITN